MDFPLFLSLISAYLIGSIPFGLILTRLAGLGDIRAIGSGNIGATNVLRTGSKKLAALTLLLDAAKGAAVVLLAQACSEYILPNSANISCVLGARCGFSEVEIDFGIFALGAIAIIGHMYPVWLKFKGGKGVATSLGVILAYMPPAGVIAFIVWLIAAVISRRSSVAALVATAFAPLTMIAIKSFITMVPELSIKFSWSQIGLCLLLVALIWWKHRANIQRLIKGTEPKIGAGAKA